MHNKQKVLYNPKYGTYMAKFIEYSHCARREQQCDRKDSIYLSKDLLQPQSLSFSSEAQTWSCLLVGSGL